MSTRKQDSESANHLRKLEALFSGSSSASVASAAAARSMPSRPAPTRQVFSNPRKSLGRAPTEYRLRMERLRIAREPEEIKEAADAFLEHHQLPDDIDVLMKVLHHPSEAILREAMGQLSALLMQGRLNTTLLIEDRLNTLESEVTEEATFSYINGLRDQLIRLKN